MSAVRSTLLLVPLDTHTPVPEQFQQDPYKETEDLSSRSISEMISWCFRYPVGLMTGDARTGAAILNNMTSSGSAVRCAYVSGFFANRSLRESLDSFKRRQVRLASSPPVHASSATTDDDVD
jgi:hypothetical protein